MAALRQRFMNLSIAQKIIFSLLVCGLLPMCIVGLLATGRAEALLKEQAFSQLDAVREIKGHAVERYFKQVRSQVLTLSQNNMVVDAMKRFQAYYNGPKLDAEYSSEDIALMKKSVQNYYMREFKQRYASENKGNNLDIIGLVSNLPLRSLVFQYHYISNNPNALGEKHLLDHAEGPEAYHRLHQYVHPPIRQYLLEFGYYDIFLVDLEEGNIVYSVFKELDYATSLRTGPYKDTNFADAYREAADELQKGEIAFRDYRLYTPSYEAPASFIAAPVFAGEKKVGVLVFQMPLEPVNEIMGDRAGMGESGESYLIGPDKLMRSDSYLDPEHHSVVASFRAPDTGKVETEAAKNSLSGETGNGIYTDYRGNQVLAAYKPIDVNGVRWALIAEIDKGEAFQAVYSLKSAIIFIGLIAAVAIAFVAYGIGRAIAGPVITLAKQMRHVSDRGDFAINIPASSSDEIGRACQAFSELLRKFSSSLSQTNDVLAAIKNGDFTKTIQGSFAGELDVLVIGVNDCVKKLSDAKVQQDEQAEKIKAALDDATHQQKLAAESQSRAEAQAEEANRVKQALDCVSTTTMIADKDYNIIYINRAGSEMMRRAETDLKKEIPRFSAEKLVGNNIDIFHKNPSYQRRILDSLNTTFQTQISVGGRYFKLVANPIYNDTGDHAGTVMEWVDRTDEVAIEKEIDGLVESAAKGDFTRTISLEDKDGFFRTLSEGLNNLVETSEASLSDIARVLESMSQGNLRERITADYAGSFGRLKLDTNATLEKLTEVIDGISLAADEVKSGATEIATGNVDLSRRTEEQATSLDMTSTRVEQITEKVRENAVNAESCATLSMEAGKVANEGGEVVKKAIDAMEAIKVSSNKIGDIIGVIDEIAFQTNLLALNAAVEAARAGEQGRGFAVVAGEVRNLAQRSATAAREIKDLINESLERVGDGANLVNESGDSLMSIVDAVEALSSRIEEINRSAAEQAEDIQEVNSAISTMDGITQQNAALVEEASAASEAMARQAGQMTEMVNFFRR